MPLYEYECTVCGHHFEQIESRHDAAAEACPQCGGQVKRLLGTGVGVVFKGSGFYATDYGGARPGCGRDRPCCGRQTPCEKKPCE